MRRYASETIRNNHFLVHLKLISAVLALGILSALALGMEGSAASTEVRALVCDESQPMVKRLSITSPPSDTVLGDSRIPLKGDIENIGQIEVYLNDAFDHALSLPLGAESFESIVQVAPGTTTIRVVGHETTGCDQRSATDATVITFQPRAITGIDAQQQNGVVVATEAGGVRVGPSLESQDTEQPSSSVFQGMTFLAPLLPLMSSLDFTSFGSVLGQVSSTIFLIGAISVLPTVFISSLPPIRTKQLLAIGILLMLLAFLIS
jgi:hypothetical protein